MDLLGCARTSFIGLCAAIGVSSQAQSSGPAIQFPLEAPVVRVGEVAKYRFIDMWNGKELRTSRVEVVEVQPDRIVTRVTLSTRSDPYTAYFAPGWQPCRHLENSPNEVCGGVFKFPMQPGSRHTFEKLPWGNGQGHSTNDCEVKGVDSIQVPAGTFDAVRVDCKGYWNRVFGGTFSGAEKGSYWYAPSNGRMVKSEYVSYDAWGKLDTQERVELMSFESSRTAPRDQRGGSR